MQALSRAFEEEISNLEVIVEIGQHYMDIGNFRDAQAIFRSLLKINNSVRACKLLGCALQEERKYTEARLYFHQGLAGAKDLERTSLLERLIEVNHSLGNNEEAEEHRMELTTLMAKKEEEHHTEKTVMDENHPVNIDTEK